MSSSFQSSTTSNNNVQQDTSSTTDPRFQQSNNTSRVSALQLPLSPVAHQRLLQIQQCSREPLTTSSAQGWALTWMPWVQG
ncbi:hypothetical protein POTOM_028652 [Populus tomentosa]|uniref:Uncharacterized protein n=1 Tax=Populus tomentosa TaxID=118781 RepID=A0A8X7ZGY1_POPTO|nr:hypothetical protein POTOM_028652 [Populus tomentosa]